MKCLVDLVPFIQSFVQGQLVQSNDFNGFPVVQEDMFIGFVGREKLRLALGLSHPLHFTSP